MKPFIYPYRLGSVSAKNLALGLGTKQLREKSDTYSYKNNHYIINWGNSKFPLWDKEEIIWANPPDLVAIAQDKLKTFEVFSECGISHPWWTTKREELDFSSNQVYLARTRLRAHSGNGIVIITRPEDIVAAPLYTRYIKKVAEFRVHVVNGKVIDFQEKRKANGWQENPSYSSSIRNKHTGWVYCRSDATLDDRCAELAINAVSLCQLDFGAVDIIYNQKSDTFYCLEINTAPGIEGTTLQSYINSFKDI